MNRRLRLSALLTATAALVVLLWGARVAHAADEVTVDDLRAMARVLGFLETLPHDGTIAIGIVYAPGEPGGRVRAAETAGRLVAIPGPNAAGFRPVLIPVDHLGQAEERLDALYLMPGVATEAGTIAEAARRRHLVSISDDPTCLAAKCCVLLVRAERQVEIILDMAMAEAVGARFSTIFTMMVTRK